MFYVKHMLDYPRFAYVDADVLSRCIDACYDSAQACSACADDCLVEQGVDELVKCIRTNLDCADICLCAARVLSRQAEYDRLLTQVIVRACAQACESCAEECEQADHRGLSHCAVCAEVCRRCQHTCLELLAALDGGPTAGRATSIAAKD